MIVRWKPLMVLSGLFLVVALMGVIAMAFVLPARTNPLLQARAERAEKNYKHAEIHYLRALQKNPRNAKLLEETAGMYGEWVDRAPAADRAKYRQLRLNKLAEAAKYGKQLAGPRRLLLAEAIQQDDGVEGVRLAKELLALDPKATDAHFVLAKDAMTSNPPDLEEARRHLDALDEENPRRIRSDWIEARVAQASKDEARLREIFDRVRETPASAVTDPVDGLALLRLRTMEAEATEEPTGLMEQVESIEADARRFAEARELSPARIAQLSHELEKVQRHLARVASKAGDGEKAQATTMVDAIEEVAEATFRKAMDSGGTSDVGIVQAYADHLLARGKREDCLKVVGQALNSPQASVPALHEAMLNLREVAIKAALADPKDPGRFDLAASHIRHLIDSKHPEYEGLGHLFQGAIDLEQSGLAEGVSASAGPDTSARQAKLREEALAHLKLAAEQLPRLGAAQALYGVGLILSQEPALGRQYLQRARTLGALEPRYLIWAAWSMVQAGYPEDAEPIVAQLLDQVGRGDAPKDLEGTLHLLKAEIHQARRTPDDLKAALTEYGRAMADGQPASPAVQLRLAQIDVLMGRADEGLRRVERLRASGQGGPAAEHLAVLTLNERGPAAVARKTLDEARARFPESSELAALDAALRVKADQPDQADRLLAEFLKRHPDDLGLTQMRAKLLAERLDRPDEARTLLNDAAERGHKTAPLVQLALMDLERRDFEAVARSIARIRARWKEAAAADLLDAQMAVARGDLQAAAMFYDAALKKDPNNKVVQLARAEIDRQTGASAEASRALLAIAQEKPVKEIDNGLTLATAAQSALAAQALQDGDYDKAIQRLEELLKGNAAGVMARPARWQLVAARSAKGQWPAAKREIAALLNDPETKATPEERVQAANFYRLNKEEPAAVAQLDYVLKTNPAHPTALVVRSFMMANAKPPQAAEAAALLRKGIAASQDAPAVLYLMLAAIENISPPQANGLARALAVVDQGLQKHPDAIELVKAKYRVVRLSRGKEAALAFVEQAARADAKGPLRSLLAEAYAEEQDYAKAEQVVRDLLASHPDDRPLAASLVRLVAAQATRAAEAGDPRLGRQKDDEAEALIRRFRSQFPNDPAFPQAECELATRRGDTARAIAIAEEIDAGAPNSPAGPLLLARLYAAQGRISEVAKAYREALDRNPRQPQVRLSLAQTYLTLDEAAEAIEQADRVLQTTPDQPSALVLKARGLAALEAPPAQRSANRTQALQLLDAAIKAQPQFADAYHQAAEIQRDLKKRPEAIATLKAGLKAVPEDRTGLSLLVQRLTEPGDGGKPATREEIQEAKALAEQYGGRDDEGPVCLALAIGFHKANQFQLAVPWAEKAATKLDTPEVHLTYGDLLLALAESTPEGAEARALLERAVAQYDRVLKAQADSIEAINNKAWILHRYFGNHQEALELAQGLLRKADPSALPGEFFDTLGAVQEALGKVEDAEESYTEGLRKAPDQPVLNYHMGRLLAADRSRSDRAKGYLEKALAASDRLPPTTAAEVESLLRKVGK